MLKQLLNLPTMSTTSEEKHRQLAPRQAAAVQPLLPRSNRVAWGCSNSTDMSLFANWSVILVRCLIRNLVRGFDSSTADSKPPCLREVLTVQDIHKKACALSNAWRTTWKKQQLPTSVLGDKWRSKISNILEFEETRKLEKIKSCNNQ